jgi:hypothetical protein
MSVWKQLRARGVQVLPTIYNDANGYHTALLPRFMALAAAPVRPKTIHAFFVRAFLLS